MAVWHSGNNVHRINKVAAHPAQLVQNYYDSESAVNLNFNTCSMIEVICINCINLHAIIYGIAYQMRWWMLILLTFLRIVLINTGLTKKFFYDFNADLREPEIYQFVSECDR